MDPSQNPLESPDIRRFIAKFLILASLASSLVLVLDRVGANRSAPEAAGTASGGNSNVPRNAFLNTAADNSDEFYKNNVSVPAGAEDYDGKNLTDNLTLAIAQQLVEKNPIGPLEYGGDNFAVTTPDVASIASNYTKLTQSNNAHLKPSIDDSKIKTANKYTQQDIIAYFEALYEIGGGSYGEDGLKVTDLFKRLKREPSRELVNGLNFLFAETEANLYNLTVPAPFLEVHKSMLATMNLQKNMFDVEGSDPMKTLLLVNNAPQVTKAQAVAVSRSFEKMKANLPKILGSAAPDTTARTASLFFKTAHAIILDFDIPEEVTSISSTISDWIVTALEDLGVTTQIAEYIAKLVTEVLKDVLINQLAKAVLNWVLGGGKTKFVVNWKGLLTSVANSAAGGVISQIAPQLCSGMGSIANIALVVPGGFNQSARLGGYRYSTQCTLDQVVNNVQNFYNDFKQGGLPAFAEIIQPRNNYFGTLMLVSDIAKLEAGKKSQAINQESTAGQGFLNPKTCVDEESLWAPQGVWESDPNFVRIQCGTLGAPSAGLCAVTMCKSDGWRTNTPGSFISSALSTAVGTDAPIQRIVNATDWSSLVGAIVGYAINKLVLSPDGLATFNQQSAAANQTDLCAKQYPNPLSQEYTDCIANANQGTGTIGNQNAAKDQALAEARSILKSSQETIPYVEFVIDTIANTILPGLDLVINSPNTNASCTTAKASALARRSQFITDLGTNRIALTSLQNTVSALPGVITTIQNGTSNDPLYYMGLVKPYGTSVEAARNLGRAEGNANRMMIVTQDVDTLVASCR